MAVRQKFSGILLRNEYWGFSFDQKPVEIDMYIQYSEEQNMLRDSAEKYLRDNYSFDQRQAVVSSDDSFSRDRWQAFADLGWLAMTFQEEHDGFGGGALETMLLCEQFGRHLVLEPYLETVVLAGSLLEDGASEAVKAQYLAGLINGEVQGALAYLEAANLSCMQHVATTAQPKDGGYVLNGNKAMVINGAAADVILVTARTKGQCNDSAGISLFAVAANAEGLTRRGYKTYDGRGACELSLQDVYLSSDNLLGTVDEGLVLVEKAVQRGVLASSAEALGAMDALLTATVDYTKQRKQFGKSISRFQVLQHRMADMFIELELCRSLLLATAWKLDSNADDALKCLLALKAKIAKSSRFISHNAMQLHGGIGTTDELNIGHYFKRLAVIQVLFGTRDEYLSRFNQQLIN
jgi:alkylation response protein AidB-like acyl-CoA dehydrogenase